MIGQVETKLKMDDYELEAVFTPAMANIFMLIFVLACNIIDSGTTPTWWIVILGIFGSVAASAIIARFFMNFFRGTSKFFEDIHYGRDRLHFLTTSMLLLNDNSISQNTKKRVRNKLKATYNISLLSQAKEDENMLEARRAAKDAIAIIRQIVAESDHSIMLHRKLKRYGAFRNFFGGALFCFPLSVICWAANLHNIGSNMAILISLLIYLIIIIVDYFLIKSAAVDYAEALIITFDKIEK